MKKITFYSFLFIFTLNTVNAQFLVKKIDGTLFTNNEVIEFTSHSNSAAELKFTVHNDASENLDFRIRCTSLINNNGSNFQLCWGGECIPSVASNQIYPDFQNIVNAGGNTIGFNDSFKNYNPGDGANYPMDFSFRFFTRDLNGNTVGTSFNLTYRYQGPLSIEQKDKLNIMGVKVLNTLVSNYIGLEINKEVKYNLTNLQGQLIKDDLLTQNTQVDLSNLQSGLYFLNFSNKEGLFDSVKIYKK
jgi:hypothetical protein